MKIILWVSVAFFVVPIHAEILRTVDDSGFAVLVTLNVTPTDASSAYVVEEKIAGAALPTEISDSGVYDVAEGKLKWGPFVDGENRALSYQLVGEIGEVDLVAALSSNGVSETNAFGPIQLDDPRTHFLGTLYLSGSLREFVESLQFDSGGGDGADPFGLYQNYAFPGKKDSLRLNAEGLFSGAERLLSFIGLVSDDALDLDYTIEVSYDLLQWLPIEQAIPGVGQAIIEPSSIDGLNSISYVDVSIDPDVIIYARIRAERQ